MAKTQFYNLFHESWVMIYVPTAVCVMNAGYVILDLSESGENHATSGHIMSSAMALCNNLVGNLLDPFNILT